MVIWHAFRIEQYRVNDHPYHAPQFSTMQFKKKIVQIFFCANIISVLGLMIFESGTVGAVLEQFFSTDTNLERTWNSFLVPVPTWN